MQSENPIAGCSRANSMITSDGAGWLSEFEKRNLPSVRWIVREDPRAKPVHSRLRERV